MKVLQEKEAGIRSSSALRRGSSWSADGRHVLMLPLNTRGETPRLVCASLLDGEVVFGLENEPRVVGFAWVTLQRFVVARQVGTRIHLTLHAYPDGVTEAEETLESTIGTDPWVRFEVTGSGQLLLAEVTERSHPRVQDLFVLALPSLALRSRITELTHAGLTVCSPSPGERLSPNGDWIMGVMSAPNTPGKDVVRLVQLRDGQPIRKVDAPAKPTLHQVWSLWLPDGTLCLVPIDGFVAYAETVVLKGERFKTQPARWSPCGLSMRTTQSRPQFDSERRRVLVCESASLGMQAPGTDRSGTVRVLDLSTGRALQAVELEHQRGRALSACWSRGNDAVFALRTFRERWFLEKLAQGANAVEPVWQSAVQADAEAEGELHALATGSVMIRAMHKNVEWCTVVDRTA